MPRRKVARRVFKEAIKQGDLRADIDIDATIDLLYAPLYYRLQIASGPISDSYIDTIFAHVIQGVASPVRKRGAVGQGQGANLGLRSTKRTGSLCG